MRNRLSLLALMALGLLGCGEAADRDPGMRPPDVAARPNAGASAERDVQLTERIRQQIIDNGFTTHAQDIEVISAPGVVTLRGPVANEEERQALLAIARGMASGARVDDQLRTAND